MSPKRGVGKDAASKLQGKAKRGATLGQLTAMLVLACAMAVPMVQIDGYASQCDAELQRRRELCQQSVSELEMVELQPGQLYYFSSLANSQNWTNAANFCESRGLEMVSVASQQENDAITEQVLQLELGWGIIWLGANDRDAEGEWRWTSGPMTFSHWHEESKQPNGGTTENCASMFTDTGGFWFDHNCNKTFPFVCHLRQPCEQLTLH